MRAKKGGARTMKIRGDKERKKKKERKRKNGTSAFGRATDKMRIHTRNVVITANRKYNNFRQKAGRQNHTLGLDRYVAM